MSYLGQVRTRVLVCHCSSPSFLLQLFRLLLLACSYPATCKHRRTSSSSSLRATGPLLLLPRPLLLSLATTWFPPLLCSPAPSGTPSMTQSWLSLLAILPSLSRPPSLCCFGRVRAHGLGVRVSGLSREGWGVGEVRCGEPSKKKKRIPLKFSHICFF